MNSDKKETVKEMIGFQEEIAQIQTYIADFESGQKLNIAIIAEPFAGRTTFLNEIEKMNQYRVTRLLFSSIVKNIDNIRLPEQSKRIVLIDDCQFLYQRKIGGFEILEYFLKSVVSSGNLYVTTWNLYSWNYLEEVINIGKYFPVQIKLPKLTKDQIKEHIMSNYKDNEIKFEEDVSYEKEKFLEPRKYEVTLKPLEKTITLPYYKVNFSVLKLNLLKKEERIAIEDIIFEKLHRVSNGNPGVSKIVWQRSLEYPSIKPSRIKDYSFNIELDYYESFVLNIILSMKSIRKNELAGIIGPDFHINKIIFRLSKQGLIADDNDSCTIRPEALKSIVEFLKKIRMVW